MYKNIFEGENMDRSESEGHLRNETPTSTVVVGFITIKYFSKKHNSSIHTYVTTKTQFFLVKYWSTTHSAIGTHRYLIKGCVPEQPQFH